MEEPSSSAAMSPGTKRDARDAPAAASAPLESGVLVCAVLLLVAVEVPVIGVAIGVVGA
jgi:hypothetical protein